MNTKEVTRTTYADGTATVLLACDVCDERTALQVSPQTAGDLMAQFEAAHGHRDKGHHKSEKK